MKLKKLLSDIKVDKITGRDEIDIISVKSDSREISKGCMFVAYKGVDTDGHLFISKAIENGANAVVYEDGNFDISGYSQNVTFIKVDDSRKALALLASNYYDNAHKNMKLIGITGTNGKTTTCELTYQLLKKLNKKVGLISTVSAKYSNKEIDTGYHVTTPDALSLHKLLYEMYTNKCEYVIIETTSHGLDQDRTWGLLFQVGVITNVTPEHLDYHKTFDKYLEAKTKIFAQSKKILLNSHDPSIDKLIQHIPLSANWRKVDYEELKIPDVFKKHFPGQYNLENLGMAHAIVYEVTGLDTSKYFSKLHSVEGRMENIKTDRGIQIIIDFAHDAVSLEKALKTVRGLTDKNVIVVFGCAGLRDRQKRPKMGSVAIKLADKVVITSEDPRTEKVEDIIKEIENGAIEAGGKKGINYFIKKDRAEAINFAINTLAQTGDLVIVTGKGHEKSMCFGTTEIPWSDRDEVRKVLLNTKAT